GDLKRGKAAAKGDIGDEFPAVPEPSLTTLEAPCDVLVTGIGGTGVVTIGQILAMAGHLEGRGVSVLDMSGLAQKGGPVMSHVKIARSPEELPVGVFDEVRRRSGGCIDYRASLARGHGAQRIGTGGDHEVTPNHEARA